MRSSHPLVLLLLGSVAARGAPNPVRLATAARCDLTATVALADLRNGSGHGQVQRKNWVPPSERERGGTASFAVTHWTTSSLTLRFIPNADGVVDLKLMGPWEEAAQGLLYQEDVLWEPPQLTGAAWLSDVAARFAQPLRAWHNQPVTLQFRVNARQPVALQISARAALPDGYVEPRRIADRNSPAHRAARRFLHGVNFGNYLEVPPSQTWSLRHDARDVRAVQAEGFDHIRLPVGWHHYAGTAPEFEVAGEIFSRVDLIVTNALALGLGVIVNVHHFDDFTTRPEAQTNKFHALWRQIAAHYASAPAGLAFELLNEPKDQATTAVMNPVYAETVRLIRRTNPHRTIFVGPGKWNSIDELSALRLPDDDNLIVTLHSYDPFHFTHQGATWAGPTTATRGIIFPGPPTTPLSPAPAVATNNGVVNWLNNYNTLPSENNPSSAAAFRHRFKQMKDWAEYFGRPVHLGEFGCYEMADAASRSRYATEARRTLEELGVGWAWWDWKAGFKYWDERNHRPAPGLREALLPGAARRN